MQPLLFPTIASQAVMSTILLLLLHIWRVMRHRVLRTISVLQDVYSNNVDDLLASARCVAHDRGGFTKICLFPLLLLTTLVNTITKRLCIQKLHACRYRINKMNRSFDRHQALMFT
jgi:hypothetical protein